MQCCCCCVLVLCTDLQPLSWCFFPTLLSSSRIYFFFLTTLTI